MGAPTVTGIRELLDGIEQRAKDAERHVSLCGPCDGGLPMACTCATVDPRETISEMITLTRAQNAALRAVLDLHNLRPRPAWTGDPDDWCSQCDGQAYPCETVRAITEALGCGA